MTQPKPAYADDAQINGTTIAFTGTEPELVFRDGSRGDWYAVNEPGAADVFAEDGTTVDRSEFDTDPTSRTSTRSERSTRRGSDLSRLRPADHRDLVRVRHGDEPHRADWFEITNFGSVACLDNAAFG